MSIKESSRVKNSFINSSIGMFVEIVNNLINFGIRTIFIYYLSIDYMGLNGLYSNILNILNLAELGFGTAITYNLYKPVADDDKERIKTLVKLYKVIYRIIGLVVLILGVSIIPFLDNIIGEAPNINENLVVIYLLFLAQVVGTYFYGYKRDVFLVYQKAYINKIIDFTFNIIKAIIQVIILITTQNYILYLLTFIITTVLSNFLISTVANHKYPFLKDKDVKKISKLELKEIINNVKSLLVYKIGTIIQNGTDNVLLTVLVNLTAVGIYSNYNTVILAVNGIIWTVLTGMKGSIGNINAKETNIRKEEILLQVNFVSSYLYGVICVCLVILLNPFVTIWIGEQYLFPLVTVISIVGCIYLKGIEFPMITYRNTLGIFREGRIAPLISAILNIVLSIILGKIYGVPGIFIATILSMCFTTIWYNPYILYKKILNISPKKYYLDMIFYLLCTIITFLVCYKINQYIPYEGIMGFIIRSIIIFILSNIIMIILVCKKKEFKEVKVKLINIIKKYKKGKC